MVSPFEDIVKDLMTKDRIEEEYKLAVLSYKYAIDEDEEMKYLREMGDLERWAYDLYGPEYCQEVEKLKDLIKPLAKKRFERRHGK